MVYHCQFCLLTKLIQIPYWDSGSSTSIYLVLTNSVGVNASFLTNL